MKSGPNYRGFVREAVRAATKGFLVTVLFFVILGLSVSTVLEQTGRL